MPTTKSSPACGANRWSVVGNWFTANELVRRQGPVVTGARPALTRSASYANARPIPWRTANAMVTRSTRLVPPPSDTMIRQGPLMQRPINHLHADRRHQIVHQCNDCGGTEA